MAVVVVASSFGAAACGGAVRGSPSSADVTFTYELEAGAQSCACGTGGAPGIRLRFRAIIANESTAPVTLVGSPAFRVRGAESEVLADEEVSISAQAARAFTFETVLEQPELVNSLAARLEARDGAELAAVVVFPTSQGDLSTPVMFGLVDRLR